MSLEGAAEMGTRLDALRELRKHLARAIDDCESKRDLSSLSARFMSVLAEIDELQGDAPAEVADEIGDALADVVNIR